MEFPVWCRDYKFKCFIYMVKKWFRSKFCHKKSGEAERLRRIANKPFSILHRDNTIYPNNNKYRPFSMDGAYDRPVIRGGFLPEGLPDENGNYRLTEESKR